MIVSRGRRYVFVHIPKTGGTALARALEARAMKDDILIGDTPKARARRRRLAGLRAAGRLWKHATLADIAGVVDAPELANLFVFTLVRNPWDRMVSYYHWLRAQSFGHRAVTLAKSVDFTAFLNDPQTSAVFRRAPYQSYTRDAEGRQRCSLFIRLEHIDDDIAPLEAHLGFRVQPLQRVNASVRDADYRSYYSDADAETLAVIFQTDIVQFGYRF